MSGINRFLSRRDKHGSERPKPKHHRGGPLHGLFVPRDEKKKLDKDEDKKLKAIVSWLSNKGIDSFQQSDILYVLNGAYASGDPGKAYDLLHLLHISENGKIQNHHSEIKMLGAINRQGVTCYLDALLFAMFARLDNFETMLLKNFDNPSCRKLATLLRLWVNLLRTGKLITVDITEQIQLQLANCGWAEAAELCQQDTSEAFSFITAALDLPLLTLKMDIFHFGKEDASDDHKFVNERLIELAIPEDPPDNHVFTLEECLEMFFNNKIEVKRYLERRNTATSQRSADFMKGHSTHIEVAEVAETSQPPTPGQQQPSFPTAQHPPSATQRRRTSSIFQEHYLADPKEDSLDHMDSIDEKASHHGRLRKEVMMSAWQFFSLIPWYTNTAPSTDAQVAQHFSSTRPILGICLKRYGISANGKAFKRKTAIDIPLEIALPHFIQDDKMVENGPAFGNFKLSLQSMVCHRGISVDSGHYVSLVRNPTSGLESEDIWLRFDDLAKERVMAVNVEQFLREESPYLLFYQVVPIEGNPENPPTYAESNASFESKVDSGVVSVSISAENGRDVSGTELSRTGTSEMHRVSTDTTTSEGSRGRSSMQGDTASNNVLSEAGGSSLRPEILNNPDRGSETSPHEGLTVLSASRSSSNVKQANVRSRPSSRSNDKASSSSLSRLANRLSRDRMPNFMNVSASLTTSKENLPAASPSEGNEPGVRSITGPAAVSTDAEKNSDRARLKKEAREKNRPPHRDHHHLVKTRQKDGKPDRECILM